LARRRPFEEVFCSCDCVPWGTYIQARKLALALPRLWRLSQHCLTTGVEYQGRAQHHDTGGKWFSVTESAVVLFEETKSRVGSRYNENAGTRLCAKRVVEPNVIVVDRESWKMATLPIMRRILLCLLTDREVRPEAQILPGSDSSLLTFGDFISFRHVWL